MKRILLFLIVLAVVLPSQGWAEMTSSQIERVKQVKFLLREVDKKTLWQTLDELQKNGHAETNLQIKEAMAKTYTEIVKEHRVQGQKNKQWLYSMIALNMAYLQFGGSGQGAKVDPLNGLILRKLEKYLPPTILNRPGFRYSLD